MELFLLVGNLCILESNQRTKERSIQGSTSQSYNAQFSGLAFDQNTYAFLFFLTFVGRLSSRPPPKDRMNLISITKNLNRQILWKRRHQVSFVFIILFQSFLDSISISGSRAIPHSSNSTSLPAATPQSKRYAVSSFLSFLFEIASTTEG